MPTFTYDDETTVELDSFVKDNTHLFYISLRNEENAPTLHQYMFVSQKDWDDYHKLRSGTIDNKKMQDKVRVGILRDAIGHYPKGLFVPYKLAGIGYVEPFMTGLIGKFQVAE